MTRTKLVLLGLVAMLAVSASTSGMASAHRFIKKSCVEVVASGPGVKFPSKAECERQENPGSGKWEHAEVVVPDAVEGESTETAMLKSEIGTTKVVIDCQNTKFTGNLLANGASEATIVYSKCTLWEDSPRKLLKECEVKPITANVKDKLLSGIEDEFEQLSETEPFAEITIGVCALKVTKLPVTGKQRCNLPSGEVFKVEHKVECTEAGSTLKFGTKTATYKGNINVKQKSGEEWASE